MIKYKEIPTTERKVESVICDKCKTQCSFEDEGFGEYLSIDYHAGYGAKYFYDMDNVKIDLCEKCLYEMVKDFARII